MSIEAMKQALDVLENTARSAVEQYVAEQKAIFALRQAIEQAEKQQALDKKADNARELGLDYEPFPVAWVCEGFGKEKHNLDYVQDDIDALEIGTALYTAPLQAEKQVPVAWMVRDSIDGFWYPCAFENPAGAIKGESKPLYAVPQQAEKQEPIAWMVYTLDGASAFVTDNPNDFTELHSCFALYTSPPRKEWVGLTDEDREILEAVRNELDRDRRDGNAPGHGHSIPGIWDSDNGDRAGKPCAWCLTWKKFKAIIDKEAKLKEKNT